MIYPRIHQYMRSCLHFLLLAMSATIISGCAELLVREPQLPGNQLLQSQFEILPTGWIYEPISGRNVWTDSDFTWGVWAIWTSFKRKDPREGNITVEVHAFPNHQLAKRFRWPSPIIRREPVQWTFSPPTADEFIVECGNQQYQSCAFNMRYDEYRVILRLSVGENLSVKDVDRLLAVTDKFMQNYLANSVTSGRSRNDRPTPNVDEILR